MTEVAADHNSLPPILLFSAAAVLSTLLTGAVLRLALRQGVIDHPNERSSHAVPTPRGGGLGIMAAGLMAVAGGVALGWISAHDALILGPGGAVLAALGWMDDRKSLNALPRLAVHLTVTILTLIGFGGMPELRVGESVITLGAAGFVLAALGIVWSINLFNFMDGIDGFAGSQAAIVFGATGALLLTRGEQSLGLIALAMSGASLGFLRWNWPPARIFMGDVGSLPIGYMLAAIAVASENKGKMPLLASAILGAVFIVDATITLIRRLLRGKIPIEAHREHAYQRLSRSVGSHRTVTLGLIGFNIVLAAIATLTALRPELLPVGLGAAALLVGVTFLIIERRAPM